MASDFQLYAHTLNELLSAQTPFVAVTIVDMRGSAPQVVGAKAIVTDAGIESGTIGGGKVEAAAIEFARQQLADTSSPDVELRKWNLQNDIGMTCGGEVHLLFELIDSAAGRSLFLARDISLNHLFRC